MATTTAHAAAWAVVAFEQMGDGDEAGELFTMLNPITHSSTAADIERYKVEPYVVAGDVYGEPRTLAAAGHRPLPPAGVARFLDGVSFPLHPG